MNQPDSVPGVKRSSGLAKFPYLGNINWLSNLYTSNYNGLQATLTQRASHGLSFVAGYTYSHSHDDSSFNINIPLPQDSRFPQLNYDSSVFDIRHRFTFSVTYNLPGVQAPAQLLKGWQLNSIVTLQSGAPWGVDDSSNNISGTNEFTDRWDFSGNPSDFKSGNSSIPYCTWPWPAVAALKLLPVPRPWLARDTTPCRTANLVSASDSRTRVRLPPGDQRGHR